MNFRIRRRRFGQLVISIATTGIATVVGRASAQSPEVIYGVSLSEASVSANQANAADFATNATNNTPSLVLTAQQVATGQVASTNQLAATSIENRQATVEIADKAIFTGPDQRLTGFTSLPNGLLVISNVVNTQRGDFNTLVFVDSRSGRVTRGLRVGGFRQSNSTIESLTATKENNLLGVISLNRGVPPFDLSFIDSRSGRLNAGNQLPALQGNLRYSNLALAPDGTIYATTVGPEGAVILSRLDLTSNSLVTGRGRVIQLAQLRFNQKALGNDLKGLAVSPSGQVYALADPNYSGTNSLFTVDVRTGEMTLVRQFPVNKITFARA